MECSTSGCRSRVGAVRAPRHRYAATELEARRGQDASVVIIGGGNSAGHAAMFHSRRAAQVHVVVRGTGLSSTMSSYLSQRLHGDDRIPIYPSFQRGVFVVGDLRARWVERVASAVGAGSVVISSVHAHLGEPRPALTPPRS